MFIQDIPTHCTPYRAQSDRITPQKPLSTSAPSQFPHQTPHKLGPTPIDMIFASGKKKIG